MALTIGHYDQGDVWTPEATFKVSGVNTDPSNITVKIKNPTGTITTVGPVSGATGGSGIVRTGAGVFNYVVSLDDAGPWYVRFEGTGTAAGTVEHQAVVDPSQFYETAQLGPRALVTVAEAKDWLNTRNIDTTDDLELARVINDISDRIHQEANREFIVNGTNPQVRVFQIGRMGLSEPIYVDGVYIGEHNPYARTISVGDLATPPTLVRVLDYDWVTPVETIGLSNITSHPMVRQSWEPIRRLEVNYTIASIYEGRRLEVTGTWGFPAVPGSIRQACLDAVAAVLDRDVEHYSQDEGLRTSSDQGNVIMQVGGSQRILSLPPAVLAACWSYRDPALA